MKASLPRNQGHISRGTEPVRWLPFLVVALFIAGCDKPQPFQTVRSNALAESLSNADAPTAQLPEATGSFELYSTLAGKMARMEELLNAIDRFLDDPEFYNRLCADAQEFHQLLTDSHGQYPKKLAHENQVKFDQAIDQTVAASKRLLSSVQTRNYNAAREALEQLSKQRQKAHTEFSH